MKNKEHTSSETAHRGFSTDQRISIESLNINRQRLTHQKEETRLVGLSIHESAIGRQIESAEARAKERCPKYDAKNFYWKRVDYLLEQQDIITRNMGSYTKTLMKDNKKMPEKVSVSDFLNQPSPAKKGSKRSFDDMTDDASVIVFDFNEESNDTNDKTDGLSIKKEMMESAKKKSGTVSKNLRSKRSRKK